MKFLFNVGGSDARALVLLLIATLFVVVGVDAQAKTPIQAKAIASEAAKWPVAVSVFTAPPAVARRVKICCLCCLCCCAAG